MASGDKTTVYDMVKEKANIVGSGFNSDKVDGKDAEAFADSTLSNIDNSIILNKIKEVDGKDSGLDADTIRGTVRNLATAWVFFDADGNIQDSMNVSAVTKNDTGDYTVTFENEFTNKYYGAVANAVRDNASSAGLCIYEKETNKLSLCTFDGANDKIDYATSVVIFGG